MGKKRELTPEQITEVIQELGMSNKQFAARFGVGERTVYRWQTAASYPRQSEEQQILAMYRQLHPGSNKNANNSPQCKLTPTQIKAARESVNMSKTEFAEELGTGVRTVYGWETGQSQPTRKMANRIKQLFMVGSTNAETLTGDDIKRIRLMNNMTQVQFAEALGVCFASVNRWENGKAKVSPLAVDKIKNMETRPVIAKADTSDHIAKIMDLLLAVANEIPAHSPDHQYMVDKVRADIIRARAEIQKQAE